MSRSEDMPEAEQDYRAVLNIDPKHPPAKARLEDLRGPAVLPKSDPAEQRVAGATVRPSGLR